MSLRVLRLPLALIALLLGGWLLYALAYDYFQGEELERAKNRSQLYQNTLDGALERFQHLPFILAQDPILIEAAAGRNLERSNDRLERFAELAGVEAIYLMNPEGLTISSSNHRQSPSFLGENYGFRPYFLEALEGRQGEFFAVGATTSRPGYFIAEPVQAPAQGVAGVLALKLDLSALSDAWATSGERVFVSNSDGVVILSSDPGFLYHTLGALPPDRLAAITAERQFGDERLDPLGWKEYGADEVLIGRKSYLHAALPVPHRGWTLHFLADQERVTERAWFAVVIVAIVLALLLAAGLYLRSKRIGSALRVSQADRRSLQSINQKLEQEVSDRRVAEARLHAAQSELARTGKLAMLGQLAASVTHELGQPISAMRNYLAAAQLGGRSSDALVGRLDGIVLRMEHITKQLRFFANPGKEPFEVFDLREAVDEAKHLMVHDFAANKLTPSMKGMDAPLLIKGNRLRIEQVIVNLLRNAVQAMEDTDEKALDLELSQSGGEARLKVTDRGHGLADQTIDHLQEPFHTTRPSGEGMGLGLAISVAIVKEHGGSLSAEAGAQGGAVFTLSLPLVEELVA